MRPYDSAVVCHQHPSGHALGRGRASLESSLPRGAGVHATAPHCSDMGSHGPGVVRHDEHGNHPTGRSEEHTSELQSLMRISYAVFCLKKKNYNKNTYKDTNQ